jgi:hypothetical protein
VVYGRDLEDRELNFEASGALLDASLVMRDRETDSWWSIMTSDAIGGELDGTRLEVLPAGRKTTWKEWSAQHPETLVLSVDGEEHVDDNPYDNYFASEETFRDLEIEDQRLEPKTPIYSFWHEGRPWAVAHDAFRGGKVVDVEELSAGALLLFRSRKGPIYESSRAFLVDRELASRHETKELLRLAEAGAEGIEPLAGFDTFWYTWVATNPETKLIR